MRPLVSWMSKVDTAILEWLRDKDIAANPKVIHVNAKEKADISYIAVRERCPALKKSGLLWSDENRGGYYAITTFGKQFLEGEVSRDTLERCYEYRNEASGFDGERDLDREDVLDELKAEGFLEDDLD